MGYKSDNAPVGYTCGKIDDVMKSIESAIDVEEIDELDISNLQTSLNILEEIRSDNSDLRDWGNDLYGQLDQIESDLEYEKAQREKIEDELYELKESINESQKKEV